MLYLTSVPNFIEIRALFILGPNLLKFGTGSYFWLVSASLIYLVAGFGWFRKFLGWFRIVSGSFGSFRMVSARFGWFRLVSGGFGSFRVGSAFSKYGCLREKLRNVKKQNFKTSSF